jgi:hypothetical protein
MAKRVTKRRYRRQPPWGKLLGKPVERCATYSWDHEGVRREIEQLATAEQFDKMVKLKEHYGIDGVTGWRPWYTLALRLAEELDDAIKIIDAPPRPTGKTAKKWRGVHGVALLRHVEEFRPSSIDGSDESALYELRKYMPDTYGKMPFRGLRRAYYDAQKHHPSEKQPKQKRRRISL